MSCANRADERKDDKVPYTENPPINLAANGGSANFDRAVAAAVLRGDVPYRGDKVYMVLRDGQCTEAEFSSFVMCPIHPSIDTKIVTFVECRYAGAVRRCHVDLISAFWRLPDLSEAKAQAMSNGELCLNVNRAIRMEKRDIPLEHQLVRSSAATELCRRGLAALPAIRDTLQALVDEEPYDALRDVWAQLLRRLITQAMPQTSNEIEWLMFTESFAATIRR